MPRSQSGEFSAIRKTGIFVDFSSAGRHRDRDRAHYQRVDFDGMHVANQPARPVRRSHSAEILRPPTPPGPSSVYENEGRYSPRGAGVPDQYGARPHSSPEVNRSPFRFCSSKRF